ncbi:nitroreductase family protein [Kitasatospora mediocidica]|uniref:nitroreductase family protein n=1 Tax=Kitasatospora mediocidica TaxID=58352 RepID=UPI00068CBD7C|nr:nitroreductase family protein [Kitasatospora mediocidica]
MTGSKTLTVAQAIRAYRTGHDLRSAPVPRELLDELLDLANLAPTRWDFKSRSIVAVTATAELEDLAWACEGQPSRPPAVLVFSADLQALQDGQDDARAPATDSSAWATESVTIFSMLREYAVKDAMVAAGFAMLAATGLGLSSAPLTGWDEEKVKEIIGIGDRRDVTVVLLLSVGYPGHDPDHHDR